MEYPRHWLPEEGCPGEWLGVADQVLPIYPKPQALRRETASGTQSWNFWERSYGIGAWREFIMFSPVKS